jgi:transcriptional regulator with XRE-family HTH domain
VLKVRREVLAAAVEVAKTQGRTQAVIARHAGISAGYLSLLLSGKRENIRPAKAQLLADELHVPSRLLFLSDMDATVTQIAS